MSSDAQTRNEQGSSNPQLPPYPDALGHPLTHSIRTMHKPLMFRDNLCKHHDVSRSYFFGAGDIYNLSHPKLFKRVLIDNRESFGKSDDFRIAFGEGLVASEGGQWQQQRQILQPLFTQNKIDSYISGMTEQIHRRADSWESGMTIDLQREMRRLTLDTLFATLFGRKLALEGDSDIHNAAVQLHDWFTPTSYPLPEWVPTPARRRFKRGRSKLRTIAGELLSKKLVP
jgi:Cytochrome P450